MLTTAHSDSFRLCYACDQLLKADISKCQDTNILNSKLQSNLITKSIHKRPPTRLYLFDHGNSEIRLYRKLETITNITTISILETIKKKTKDT